MNLTTSELVLNCTDLGSSLEADYSFDRNSNQAGNRPNKPPVEVERESGGLGA